MEIKGRLRCLPVVALLLILCSSCSRTLYFARQVKIDEALHVIPVGKTTAEKPSGNSYYRFFRAGSGITLITHSEVSSQKGVPDQTLVYLETNANDTIDRTVKTD